MLYNALIHPLLLRGITSWALTYSSRLDALLAMQNKFIKILHFRDQYDSPHPLYISSNILKINELHNLYLASFVYESSLQQNPREFHNYFCNISEIHSHATRQSINPRRSRIIHPTKKYNLVWLILSPLCWSFSLEQYSQGYQK